MSLVTEGASTPRGASCCAESTVSWELAPRDMSTGHAAAWSGGAGETGPTFLSYTRLAPSDKAKGKQEDVGSHSPDLSSTSQDTGGRRRVQNRCAGRAEDTQHQIIEDPGNQMCEFSPPREAPALKMTSRLQELGPGKIAKGIKTSAGRIQNVQLDVTLAPEGNYHVILWFTRIITSQVVWVTNPYPTRQSSPRRVSRVF